MRTLFIGLTAGFLLYGAGIFLPQYVEGPVGQWGGVALLALSLLVTTAWFVAVKRGFRLGRAPNRLDRKLKERKQAEKAKKMRMFRR